MDCDSDDIQTLLQGFWESQDATICNQYVMLNGAWFSF